MTAFDSVSTMELISPATGCDVLNQTIEEIRQAVLKHSGLVEETMRQWNSKSPFDFVVVIENLYEEQRLSLRLGDSWRLIESANHLLNRTFQMSCGGSPSSPLCDVAVRVPVLGTGYRYQFDLLKERLELSGEDWPFWLEAMRNSPHGGLDSFESIQEQSRELLSVVSHVRRRIDGCISSLDSDSEPVSPEERDFQLWQYALLRKGLEFTEEMIVRIVRSLHVIAIAISAAGPLIAESRKVFTNLSRSVGFQHVGSRLTGVLAERFRAGKFTVLRADLLKAIGSTKNAFNSAITALKEQQVVVGTGFGNLEEFWIMPVICELAERYSSRNDELKCPLNYGEPVSSSEEHTDAVIPAKPCTVPAVESLLHAAPTPHLLRPADNQPPPENATPVIYDPASQNDGKTPPAVLDGFIPSQDYRSAVHNSVTHSFTTNQARCVEYLYKQWKNGTPEVAISTVLEQIDCTGNRLDQVFRNTRGDKKGTHAAWRTLIVPGETKGSVRLNIPGPAPAPTK